MFYSSQYAFMVFDAQRKSFIKTHTHTHIHTPLPSRDIIIYYTIPYHIDIFTLLGPKRETKRINGPMTHDCVFCSSVFEGEVGLDCSFGSAGVSLLEPQPKELLLSFKRL